jgi:hypothetical protein
LSIAEQAALTERITRLAASERWKATLAQNGWEDQFLTGQPLRQFLLAEQARIDAVLRRLSATETAGATRGTLLTPMTLPASIGTLFVVALALVVMKKAGQRPVFDRQGMRMVSAIIVTLLILPLAFWVIGFVASSTLLFAIAATAMRGARPMARTTAIDLIVGAVFSIALFLMFTRGLGVILPGPSFL